MSRDWLGEAALAWVALGAGLPPGSLRLVLADVDGVITRGEGQPAELDVLERLAAINAAARRDPRVPAITLCTGRQAPYVELLAQLLADRDRESLTIVFQIASTPYVAEEGRRRIHTALRDAGRGGSLAFLNATRPAQGWQRDGYGLELQAWPGERRHIGHLDFHGEWLSWQG